MRNKQDTKGTTINFPPVGNNRNTAFTLVSTKMAKGQKLIGNTTLRWMLWPCQLFRTFPAVFMFLVINTTAVAAASTSPIVRFLIFCGYFEHGGWAIIILLALTGCVANSFNIIIFRKLGLDESINVAFFGIACADFASCASAVVYAFCYHPDVELVFLGVFSVVLSDVGGRLTFIVTTASGMISALITAYMAIQRCLCVAMPLKVRAIFTARRTKIVVVLLVLLTVAMRMPHFLIYRFGWIQYNGTIVNGTTVSLFYFGQTRAIFGNSRDTLVDFAFMTQGIIQASASIVIIICTVILWIHLILQSKWRKGVAAVTASGSDTAATSSASSKEMKVVKTVVSVCTLYVVCAVPVLVISVGYGMDQGLIQQGGPAGQGYQQLVYEFILQVCLIAQGVNISANIFIYYSVSSQYHDAFNQTFSFHRCCAAKEPSSKETSRK